MQPIQPIQAFQPFQPFQPVQPVQLIQPVQPVQPVQSVQPVKPIQVQNQSWSFGPKVNTELPTTHHKPPPQPTNTSENFLLSIGGV